jgi:NAD(P)-dependent dehydrogenase (short-subunit alcohol dehydrogenase family)
MQQLRRQAMNVRGHAGEVALVTGANKGLGREIARRLAAEGLVVYLGARDERRGRKAAEELRADGGNVHVLQLDVTQQAEIEAAVAQIEAETGQLNVLVNNAGVLLEMDTPVAETRIDQFRETYEVNVFGAIALTVACIPLLRRSAPARVVNMSTPLGSLSLLAEPESHFAKRSMLAYSSSKAALNCATVVYASALRDDGVLVNAAWPGFVATDLNRNRGSRTAEHGAELPVELALLDADGPTGGFFTHADDGTRRSVAW